MPDSCQHHEACWSAGAVRRELRFRDVRAVSELTRKWNQINHFCIYMSEELWPLEDAP